MTIQATSRTSGGGPADVARRLAAGTLTTLAVLLSVGCGADEPDVAASASTDPASDVADVDDVEVSLDEYVVVAPTELDAGQMTLDVKNDGTENHQLTIVAAESYESLPQRENGSVKIEDLEPSSVIVTTEPFFAGFPAEPVAVDLEPGTYVFFCGLQSFTGDKSHVGLGQRLVVTVT